ncbi:MAG: hypothetical protein ACOX4M_08785 [Acetivibrionales bacterium]|jgi:gas vesicle protein
MSRLQLRSVLLGIGIGIIITSIASLIFLAGRNPLEGVTREQIIREAEKYGMVGVTLQDKGTYDYRNN